MSVYSISERLAMCWCAFTRAQCVFEGSIGMRLEAYRQLTEQQGVWRRGYLRRVWGKTREEGAEKCWRAYRGIGHSWFLIESPPYYTKSWCVRQNTRIHLFLLSNFPADGSEELNTLIRQQPSYETLCTVSAVVMWLIKSSTNQGLWQLCAPIKSPVFLFTSACYLIWGNPV